ncbi:MAG TPA: efflux RND transporter periplasmic adaptor subunit [Prolixibacteraceae bacterium]|nr:efflux RND transporter periplasmic adaptor subunit [Prolixibacteraceae bacterium]
MSWRKITFIIVSLVVLLGGSFALSELFVSLKPEPPRRPESDAKRYVKAEEVKYVDIVSPLSREGRVASSNEVVLVSEAAGKIEAGQVTLKKGASFKKGQLIARIYKDEVELALKASKSRFLNVFTQILPDIKVDFPDSYDRFLAFFNSVDLNKDIPELPQVNNEKLKIFLASRNILSDYYGIRQDEKRLSRHTFYAPFDGTFTMVNFEVGAYVNAGGQIAKMIRTDQLEIEVPVENSQSEWIEIGDQVNVFSRDRTAHSPGKVVRKSNFVEASSQSRSVFVQVRNPEKTNLLAGEYKLVEFPGQLVTNAMEIPRSAVFNTNEVFIVLDGKLKKRELNILKWNETTLIFDGLDEGSQLVVEPLINVQENSPVGIVGEEEGGKKVDELTSLGE